MTWMRTDSLLPRLAAMAAFSVVLHGMIGWWAGSRPHASGAKALKLTEVEYQEETPAPSEAEKLMAKLAAPSAAPSDGRDVAGAAQAELEKTSFRQVVGVVSRAQTQENPEADLSRLAALPSLTELHSAATSPGIPVPVRAPKFSLVRSAPSAEEQLSANVVPVDELPPADFGPDIDRRDFQSPESIVKQVKAERRQALGGGPGQAPGLRRDVSIQGEVKNREILHRETVPIPRWLEEKGIEAEVLVRFVVNPDGEVGNSLFVERTSGYAELDKIALETVKKFIFAPLPLTGKQVEQSGILRIRFTIQKG